MWKWFDNFSHKWQKCQARNISCHKETQKLFIQQENPGNIAFTFRIGNESRLFTSSHQFSGIGWTWKRRWHYYFKSPVFPFMINEIVRNIFFIKNAIIFKWDQSKIVLDFSWSSDFFVTYKFLIWNFSPDITVTFVESVDLPWRLHCSSSLFLCNFSLFFF